MLERTAEPQRRRWGALGVVVAAYVLSFFQRFAPAGIAQDLAVAFHTSAASLGVLAATYFYVYTLMQVPTGILVDTLGPRRILLLGGLVGGVGSLLFGLAPTLEMALVGRTLVGLGVSVTFIAMLKIIALWFEEHRFATMVGAAMLVGNLGSILAGAPLSAFAQAAGWRGAFLGVGTISLVLAMACWFLVRDRPAAGGAGFDRTVVLAGLWSVLKNRATWPVVAVNTGMAGAFFTFGGLWATPYLMQVHHLSRQTAASHLSLWFGGFALGCLFIGSLSDRLGRRKPVLIAASLAFALLWVVWASCVTLPLWLSYALFAAMGVVTAGFSLTWACAKEVNPPLLSGMSTSVANMGGFLAGALLQPAVGWIMDLGWHGELRDGARIYSVEAWRNGVLVVTGFAWCGAAAAWRIKETGCRNIWRST